MRTRKFHFVLAIAVIVSPLTAFAQKDDKAGAKDSAPAKKKVVKREFTKKPLLRAWFTLDENEVSKYTQQVMKDYSVESPLTAALQRSAMDAGEKPELQGMLVLLAKGLIPVPVQIQFRSVKDEREFHQQIMRVKDQMGAAGTLSGTGDHFELEMDFSKGIPIFGSADAEEPELLQIPGMSKANPAMMQQLVQTMHFRMVDGIMWSGQVPEIMELDLPTAEQLKPTQNPDSFDMLAEFNLTDIPFYLKSMAMGAVNASVSTQLQQRDDEEQLFYNARRSNGDFWLELLRTAVYDIDKGKLSVRFARGDDPVRIRLNLDARANSNFEKAGKVIKAGRSRFASIRNRPAPMTVASTFGIPTMLKKLLVSALELGRREFEKENKDNDGALTAVGQMYSMVQKTVEEGNADFMMQLAGDVNSGFAVVGGMRVSGANQLRDGLDGLLSSFKETDRIQRSTDSTGRQYISLEVGESTVPGTEDDKFMSTVHLTSYNSCLWFGFGGPGANELLQQTIAFDLTQEESAKRSSEVFQFRFDLSQWLEGDDDKAGFNQYPRQALLEMERKMEIGMASIFRGGNFKRKQGAKNFELEFDESKARKEDFWETEVSRPSMFLKVLEQGGDEVDLRMNIDKAGVNLDINVGRGMANMLLARMADFQGKAMGMLKDMSEAQKMQEVEPADK